ncbi:hypothetical protein [Falsiroseomonas selenitidurans]|uniref:DUF2188 domain-containing protein n=1 Tax=Falsiroseomonas selenitidurans TaxID=2716335 RepID=A0ABX1E8B2_9PROT|nr:hypothetical protein [Falsiroseomonas selenitidurans]NKC33464.1 hypothetical protein [Falsiroseomonas selenitidurans]
MQPENKTTSRWVVRDENGNWVETHACETLEQAIRLFCHPSLRWDAYEADGWTITSEPLAAPLGKASAANMEPGL